MLNPNSLDTLCGALAYAMGIEPPAHAAEKNADLAAYIDAVFSGEKADRIVMYNPDAVAQWLLEKYPDYTWEATGVADLKLPLQTVMPSVTPVCFATMYTGAQPAVHGIRKYEKPLVAIDTFFDALIRAGKKVALISSYPTSSMSTIFGGKAMDYYITDNITKTSVIAAELILKDAHDVIIIYQGNYDYAMHHNGPESPKALSELRCNAHAFVQLAELIQRNWKHHNTLLGFAMDHGCHEIDGDSGSHGLDMEEDLNIMHLYKGYPKEKQ